VLEGLVRVCIVGHFAETINAVQILLQSDVEKMDYSTILAKMANLYHLFHKALDEYRVPFLAGES
jgi:pyridoxal biosynthesis lyase PdxS